MGLYLSLANMDDASEKIDEEQKPMSFVQTFQLVPEGGSFYVFNDVFKLVYPAA